MTKCAAPPRIITIVARDESDFDVHDGENVATRLCWDEMLGCVARLTLGKGPAYLRSVDWLVEQMARWKRVIDQKERQTTNQRSDEDGNS